jgi:hypothetical protein
MFKTINSAISTPISLPIPSSNKLSHISSFTQTQPTGNEDDPEYLHLIFLTSIGKVVIKCKLCESFFDNLPLFNIHVKSKHKYHNLCRVCYKVFYNKNQQKIHMREIHGKLFNCDYCEKNFWDFSGLKDHIRSIHPGMELPSASIRSNLNLYGTLVDSDMDTIYTTSINDAALNDTTTIDTTFIDTTITDTTIEEITAAMTATTIVDSTTADTTSAITIDSNSLTTVPGITPFRSELFENQASCIIDNIEKVNRKKIIKRKHDDNATLIHEYVYDDDDDVMLKCKLCEDIFLSNKEFNKHAKSEHDVKYLCFSCSEVFQDKKLCGRHIGKYHAMYCIYCVKRFNLEDSLEKHILEFHSQEANKNLEVINSNSEITFRDDELREVNQVIQNINTNENDAFFLHETLQVNSGTIVKCKKCEKTFNCLTMFRYHARSEHNYEWLCLVCCLVFSSGKIRGKHMRKFHKKNFSCTLCIKKFYDKIGLVEHFHAKHRGETFPHILTTTPIPTPSIPPIPSTSIPPIPSTSIPPIPSTSIPLIPSIPSPTSSFIHEIIPYEFPSDKKPPYQLKCKLCETMFNTHSQFNTHAKALHNCAFLCTFCSQIFSQKQLKKEHARREHVFNCQVCGKNLHSEKGLMKHHKIKHGQMKILFICLILLLNII